MLLSVHTGHSARGETRTRVSCTDTEFVIDAQLDGYNGARFTWA